MMLINTKRTIKDIKAEVDLHINYAFLLQDPYESPHIRSVNIVHTHTYTHHKNNLHNHSPRQRPADHTNLVQTDSYTAGIAVLAAPAQHDSWGVQKIVCMVLVHLVQSMRS